MRKLVLLPLIFLLSCAQKVWILEGLNEAKNGVRISVKTGEWKYSPSNLGYYVFPVYVELENLSDSAINIGREEVYIIDERGNQYNPISPSDVHSMLQRKYGLSFGFGLGYYSYPWHVWWHPYYAFPPSREVYPDVLNYAFNFGTVQPRARLRGFVYFPLLPSDVSTASLYVKGYKFNLKLETKR